MHIDGATRIVILAAAMASISCDEPLSRIAGPTPNLEPTLSSIEREIFNATDSSGRRACTNCHSDAGGRVPPTGMVLLPGRSFDSIVNVAVRGKPGAIRVIPGDPENSYLVHKLEGRSGTAGLRMPIGGPPFLTDGQILIIKRWIELGARRD
jgi:hypothetical protein